MVEGVVVVEEPLFRSPYGTGDNGAVVVPVDEVCRSVLVVVDVVDRDKVVGWDGRSCGIACGSGRGRRSPSSSLPTA